MTLSVTNTEERPAGASARKQHQGSAALPGEAGFAELFATLQSGYGAGVLSARAGASPSKAFSPAVEGNARQCRVAQMTSEARTDARESAGRHAGLSDAPETRELGGRGQRLGLEKESAADPRSGQARGPTTASANSDNGKAAPPGNAEAVQPRVENRDTVPFDRRNPRPIHSPRSNDAGNHKQTDTSPKPGDGDRSVTSGDMRLESPPPASSSSARVAQASRIAAAAKSAPPVARQIAQLLSAKLEGPDVARNADSPATARGDGKPSHSTARSIARGKAGDLGRATGGNDVARSVFDKMVRNIRMNIGTRQSTAKIRLHPPELGQVRVDVKMVDSRIELRVQVETPAARELIGERIEALRGALQNHGLITERLELVEQRPEQQASTAPDDGYHPDDPNAAPSSERRAEDRNEETDSKEEQGPYVRAEEAEENDDTIVTVLDARLDIHI